MQGRATFFRIIDQSFNFCHRLTIDQRTNIRTGNEAVADSLRMTCGDEFFDKAFIDPVLHENAVGTNAGLAAVAEFGNHGPGHGGIDVGIIHHDERRIAAQFKRQLLDRRRTLHHQPFADLGRAGEGQHPYARIPRQSLANRHGLAGHDVKHPRRETRHFGKFCGGQCRNRGIFGWFDNNCAPRRQCRGTFAHDHGQRKVPWRDRRHDTHGMLLHHHAPVTLGRGHGLPIGALGFLSIPFGIGNGADNFAQGLIIGFTLFKRDQGGQIILILFQKVAPTFKVTGSFLCQHARPCRERCIRGINRAPCLGGAHEGHIADNLAGCRIIHINGFARISTRPFAIDECLIKVPVGDQPAGARSALTNGGLAGIGGGVGHSGHLGAFPCARHLQ